MIFALVVDGDITGFYSGGIFNIQAPALSAWASIERTFEGLSAGAHTIQVYGMTFTGECNDITMDPGGYYGSIMVKEIW